MPVKRIVNRKTGVVMPDPGIRVGIAGRYRLRNGWVVMVDIIKEKYVQGLMPKLNSLSSRTNFENFSDWQWARTGGKSLTLIDEQYDIVAPAPDRAVLTTAT